MSRARSRRFLARGEWWRIRYANLRKDWGRCDYEHRELLIARKQSERDELDTTVHEAIHAEIPVDSICAMDEAATARLAGVVSEVLWLMGWRKQEIE